MKKILSLILVTCLLLSGCTVKTTEDEILFESRFETENVITLSNDKIIFNGDEVGGEGDVFLSNDIIYYEEKQAYESGNPYGEGSQKDMHSKEEADKHTVLNITKSGAYRIKGTLDAGQIRIDLGEDAKKDPNAVVELILDNADITCTVAPAILFMNVYECDENWTVENAKSTIDTSKAGAVLVLADNSKNIVNGSYVEKIFEDNGEEKKLWKQDGAIYSYMSMNVFGSGALDLYASNEGLDTELHLTINGGDINIYSGNDGINTNEDGVSVTTINGGNINIYAGLGEEGDGIDSNGWLVINGGNVFSSANPKADAGLDSDLGSFINGGTVVAVGSTMDWPESDSNQVTVNLQFANSQNFESEIVIKDADDKTVFEKNISHNELTKDKIRDFRGAVISSANLAVGEEYTVYVNGVRQGYTGTDFKGRPGQFGGMKPEDMPDFPEGERPTPPNMRIHDGERSPMRGGEHQKQFGDMKDFSKEERPPMDFENMQDNAEQKEKFPMTDKVNRFSGVSEFK